MSVLLIVIFFLKGEVENLCYICFIVYYMSCIYIRKIVGKVFGFCYKLIKYIEIFF